MKRDKVAAATEWAQSYLASGRGDPSPWWGKLPDGVDHGLVRQVLDRACSHPSDPSIDSFPWRTAANALGRRSFNVSYLDDLIAVVAGRPAWPESCAVRCLPEGTAQERAATLGDLFRKIEMLGVNDAAKRSARVREYAGDARLVEVVRQILATCALAKLEPVFRHGYTCLLAADGSPASIEALAALARRALSGEDYLCPMLSRTLDGANPALAALVAQLRAKVQP